MAERIYLWDNLKVMLMMMVVMTHSVNVYQIDGHEWIQYFWILIMTYTMPLFMMISGFWYKQRNAKYCLKHYLYPCLVFSVINIVGGAICGAYPEGNIPLKMGWAMWYIWALFIYNLITPYLLKHIDVNRLLLFSIIVSFVCGIKFLSNSFLDAQRVVHFYPFYMIGMWLRTKESYIYHASSKIKSYGLCIFLLCNIVYAILCYVFPGFCYGTGFMGSHGLSIIGFTGKWGNFILTLVMSVCVILLMPNKQYSITRYGARTMNVYMLHMSIVFPLSWYCLRPIMDEWYGYVLYIIAVPTLCTFLFSQEVDRFMKSILSLPDKIIK